MIEQSVTVLRPTSKESAAEGLKLVEYAGRNCYRSQDKITGDSYRDFIDRVLLRRGHMSPMEFEDMTVEIVTSRDVLAEITRHRHCSFAVQSQRYVVDDKTGDIFFIKPDYYIPGDVLSPDVKRWCASRKWEENCRNMEADYKYLKHECSMPAQDSRKVLGNSVACVIVMKANLREWLHIFELRNSAAAYPEMRTMMRKVIEKFDELYPGIYQGEPDE